MMEEVYRPLSERKGELALMIIDVQDSLMRPVEMEFRRRAINNIKLLIALAYKLNFPLLLTEQYPKGLGRTVSEIQQALEDYQPIEKVSFSCCGDEGFKSRLRQLDSARRLILVGVEAHVCVLQTALDLLANGYEVHVVSDAVCSWRKLDWEVGLRLMEKAGATITTTEILIFQLLGRSGTDEFRFMSKLFKQMADCE